MAAFYTRVSTRGIMALRRRTTTSVDWVEAEAYGDEEVEATFVVEVPARISDEDLQVR